MGQNFVSFFKNPEEVTIPKSTHDDRQIPLLQIPQWPAGATHAAEATLY
jgi:hypothetical protein